MRTSKLKPKKLSKSSKTLPSSNKHHPSSASVCPQVDVDQPPITGVSHQPKVRKVARGQPANELNSATKSLQVQVNDMLRLRGTLSS